MITRTFKLCLNAGTGSAPYINVSQYDEGETWLFELYSETGERYIPTTGAIVGVKSDGHGIANTGTVDSEGRVVITETQQMTASAGRAIYELSIDGLTHGTANFIVAVERKPTDDAVMSDSDLSLIQEAIDSAEVIVEVIGDGDPSEVIGEHVDAWLDNHPEATTTVQDGAITAPKINQSLWDKLLVSEEASGNPASFDDGADDVPVSSLKVALEPIQTGSGDPSPSNIRPIYPANNRNQFPSTADGTYTNSGVTVVANNGVYTVTGTATETSYIELSLATSVDLSPATNQFAFLNSVTDGNIEFAVYRDSTRVHYWAMSPQNRVTANWPDTGNEVVNKIRFNFQNGKTYNITISPVLCLATYPTPTAFTPYQGIMVDVFGGNLIDLAGKWSENATHYGYTAMLPAGTYYAYIFTEGNEAAYNSIAQYSLDGTTYTDILTTDNGYAVCDATMQYNRKKSRITLHQSSYIRICLQGVNHVNRQIYVLLTPNGSEYDSMPNVPPYAYASTMWMPYVAPTQYPYTLGQSVYGGTVDLATGVLTVDRAIRTVNGSENWVRENAGTSHKKYFITDSTIAKSSNYKTSAYIICDKLPTAINSFDYTTDYIMAITAWSGSSSANYLYIMVNTDNTDIADATALKAWLAENPLTVVYKLATPTTIQLTPQEVKTLLGYNNISSTGTVDVIYHADTKLYVDKMTAVDNNIIAPTEEGFTATRNYTVNDLVIVNDTLYKVTSNIQNGGTITPNSNVQQTTLGALIKALS